MKRIWLSFSIIFGVVPEAISACQPDTAPQAMVMNRNGNRLPGPDRAGAVDEPGQRRHLQVGAHDDDADRQQQ